MKHRNAFTLIELLVVIAIIALLMSVIMPSLNKAKLLAEEVICRSNLKQYGLAGQMYTEDHDGKFPNPWDSIFKSRDPARVCQWHDMSRHPSVRTDLQGSLWNYLGGGNKVHYCRTFARFAKSGEYHKDHDPSIPIEPLFCYSMNGFLGGFESTNSNYMVVKTSQVKSPTRVFFFAEENAWPYTPSESDAYYPYKRYQDTLNDNALCGARKLPHDAAAWTDSLEQGPPYLDSFGSYHKTTSQKRNEGMANATFIDGHVEMVDPDRTYYYSKPMDKQPPLMER